MLRASKKNSPIEGWGGKVKIDLLPQRCPACGTTGVPTWAPGTGPHLAKAVCGACGRFFRWLGRAELAREKESGMGGTSRAIVIGTISRPGVEVRYSGAGIACASFTLTVTEHGQDGKEHPTFIACECWGKQAEQAGECEAGQLCLFEGRLAKRRKGEQWELIVSGYALMPLAQPQPSPVGSPH